MWRDDPERENSGATRSAAKAWANTRTRRSSRRGSRVRTRATTAPGRIAGLFSPIVLAVPGQDEERTRAEREYAKHERGLINDRGQLDEEVEDEGERQHSDEHRPQSTSG